MEAAAYHDSAAAQHECIPKPRRRGSLLKPFGRALLKRSLEGGILAFSSVLTVVLFTGPVRTTIAGIPVEVNHSFHPLAIVFALALLRMALTVEGTKILLILGSMTFTLLVVETALHVLDPPIARWTMTQIHTASPVFGWDLVPGTSGIGSLGESYRINSAGFRDVEHALAKRAGVHRIMVVGDSFTFGMGVNLVDSYPKQLERILNRGDETYEVINCGVIGHNMWQHYEVLRRKVLPYRPDLVILGLFEDDIGSSVSPTDESAEYRGRNPFEEPGSSPILMSLRHIAVWNLSRNAKTLLEYKYRHRGGATYVESIEARRQWWGPARPLDHNYRVMSGKMDKARYVEFSIALKRFVTIAKGSGATLLVVMIPDSVQLNDPHMQFVNRFVERVTAEIGVPFVDTTPFLEAENDPTRPLYLFPYDAHNSPRGLNVIAKAIADRIVELGFFDSDRTGQRVSSAGAGRDKPE